MNAETQRTQALLSANRIRSDRAKIKAHLGEDYGREETLCRHILEVPRCLMSASVGSMLTWPKGWGPGKAKRVLRELGIMPGRTCGQLTLRERAILVRGILEHSPRVPVILADPKGERWVVRGREQGTDRRLVKLELLEGENPTGILAYESPTVTSQWERTL